MATPSLSSTRTCLCSPTNHPGSFRCSLHRSSAKVSSKSAAAVAATTPRANIRQLEKESRAATMMNTTSTVKTNLIKAILKQIIKPSSQDQQRRRNFHPKPTRFCPFKLNGNGNGNGNGVAVS